MRRGRAYRPCCQARRIVRAGRPRTRACLWRPFCGGYAAGGPGGTCPSGSGPGTGGRALFALETQRRVGQGVGGLAGRIRAGPAASRFDHRARPPAGRRRAETKGPQALGRRRGGLSPTLPLSGDGQGRPRQVALAGAQAVIPSKKNRTVFIAHDEQIYKNRNQIERCFNRLNADHAIATRFEKTALAYLALVTLAAIRMWL